MIVTVKLSLALICFAGQCDNALAGKATPIGDFHLQRRYVLSPGYGGDVLSFKEDTRSVFAIHRVWNERPKERRSERLASPNTSDRQFITNGCINVSPEVYERLIDCCSAADLHIEP